MRTTGSSGHRDAGRDRVLDQLADRVRVRQHDDVRGPVHFNRLYGSSTFGHEGVGSWRNVLVKRAVDEPGWDRLPRRISGHSADRAGREWPLSHGHESGVGLRDIRAELRPEFVLLQVQVRVAIGQRHHAELVAERAAWKAIGEVARALTKV